MKTHQPKFSKSHSGMTLLEITVVILVMLSLISALFMGANAWKKGSDRSFAILLIRNAQQGVRSHLNIENVADEPAFPDLAVHVFGQNKYVPNGYLANGNPKPDGELPDHPRQGLSFGFAQGDSDIIPPFGELYVCTGGVSSVNDYSFNPKPSDYSNW